MNTTSASPSSPSSHSSPAADPAPERGVLLDLLAVSPSATLGRELFALLANLAIVGLIVIVLQPRAIVAAVMFGVVGVFMLGRLVVGFRTRGYGASLRGER